MNYNQTLKEEAKTWLIEDPDMFRDKKQRETVRYPLLSKQMGLNFLDTSNMVVYDVGAGPFGGVSSVLNTRTTKRFDPLRDTYQEIVNVDSYSDEKAEDIDYSPADLIVATNSIDHFENPNAFFYRLLNTMSPGSYFAHFHAINNAITHPHPAHVHNIDPELIRSILRPDYEEVWYLDHQGDGLTYGWRRQPAFCGLYRKVTGYGKANK